VLTCGSGILNSTFSVEESRVLTRVKIVASALAVTVLLLGVALWSRSWGSPSPHYDSLRDLRQDLGSTCWSSCTLRVFRSESELGEWRTAAQAALDSEGVDHWYTFVQGRNWFVHCEEVQECRQVAERTGGELVTLR
jgi:hypothetical protein